MTPALAAAFDATWPAADYASAGGFTVGRGLGAGGRVSSARVTGDWGPDDIDAACAALRAWDQPPLFRVSDGDTALAGALADRGFARHTATAILTAPVSALTDQPIPPVTAFAIWPPLAIQRDIWTVCGVGAARQQVMARAPTPKTALLGRIRDRAAGTGFAAIHGNIAMLHALEVLPDWRRLGLGGWMVRQAAFWATGHGASDLALAVTRENAGAYALYHNLGFTEAGGYSYWQCSE